MSPALGLMAFAILIAAVTWLSLRLVPMSQLDVLPSRCRRRIRWRQLNARWIYLCCAAFAIGAGLTHLSS